MKVILYNKEKENQKNAAYAILTKKTKDRKRDKNKSRRIANKKLSIRQQLIKCWFILFRRLSPS